jgi:chitin disaccharide deacetylase
MKTIIWLVLILSICGLAAGQSATKSLVEKLGYPAGTKLLIVHADDLGFSHSVDAATIKALESGSVTSASLMVPCPWFPEMADYAKAHPEVDFGLHLTLTSERTFYRWGPVASRDQVATLLDATGYFRQDWTESTVIDPAQVEIELRAQIDRAYAMGLKPTHLDSHQFRLLQTGKDLFAVFLRVAHDYKLPALIPRNWFAEHPYLQALVAPDDVVIDQVVTIMPEVTRDHWAAFYDNAIKSLPAGVTELVIHPGFDNDELQAMTRERPTWGAAWRQRDYDYFTNPRFRELLRQNDVKLVTWRELHKALSR